MSEFDYDGDGGNVEELPDEECNNEAVDDGGEGTLSDSPGPMTNRGPKSFRNARYNNAFGDYRGGYGPGGGFGPPRFGPPRFGPPPLMWGCGFGPNGPPMRRNPMDDRVIKYLIRCGVPKEQLKNLPRDLLCLIEPNYCSLCAISLDSFTTSRMHYISKNHMKNQKKWLNQNSEGLFLHHNREMPLKSRDLYCELCDVHITSKAHAETHYAGKPHRAIVEGRKLPRNPVLLQRGMERRVDQLIRREKKYLKPVEETTEVPEEKKAIQPDLYCEICNTTVTCSEQMTMHLNGKKHLAKEKHHILKMMKGGVDDNTAAYEETTEGDQNEGDENTEGGAEDNQEEKNDKEDFGWGQGEEKWEETAD